MCCILIIKSILKINMKKIWLNKIKIPKIHPTIQLALAVLLFVVAVVFSRGNDMTEWEVSIFLAIYNLSDTLWTPFFFITQTGSIHMLGILLLVFLIKKKYHLVLRLLLTATLAYQLSGFAKDIWGRLRPNEILPGIYNLDYVVRGPGFPSGHTALATAMALVVGFYLPRKYQWIIPIWIIGVGLSRIFLGIHAPLDIVGGFAIGWIAYALFRHVRMQDISFRKKRSARA